MQGRGEFRRNWRVAAAAFVGMFTGVTAFPMYVIGPFLPYYRAEFGWSATAISLCSTCYGAGLFLTSPLTGVLTDRFGVRRVAMTSQTLLAACFFALSFLGGPVAVLFLLYFACGSLGSGAGPITHSRAINGWFETSRGFALGIALAGTGLASALAPLIVEAIAPEHGWRSAWRFLSLLLLLAVPVLFWGLKEPPHSRADLMRAGSQQTAAHDIDGATSGQAVRTPVFWISSFSVVTLSVFLPQLIIHFGPSMMERGLSRPAAAANTALLGVAMLLGRLSVGWVIDRVFAPLVACVMFLAAAAGCALFGWLGAPLAAPMIIAMGLVMGAEVDMMSFLTAKYFGLRHFGRIFGVVTSIYTGSALFSPLVATPLRAFGGYPALYFAAAASFTIGGVAFLFLGPYRRGSAAPSPLAAGGPIETVTGP
jgi:MFS family permease